MIPAGNLLRSLRLVGLEISDLAEYYLWTTQWHLLAWQYCPLGFAVLSLLSFSLECL